MISSIIAAIVDLVSGPHNEQEYYTSILSGHDWVLELLNGHPDRIRSELGVSHHVFNLLLSHLRDLGYKDSPLDRGVTLEEQLAVFLYTCVTGLTIPHVGERFQRASDTIEKYFKTMLLALSSAPFYDSQVQLLKISEIHDDPKRFPFFKDALGAIGGTHIDCFPSEQESQEGLLTQNCFVACSFDLRFLYVLTSSNGSAADSLAHLTSSPTPQGKYYLADADVPLCDQLLVPYRGVRDLAEWGQANVCPANKEEQFNLRHAASAQNVIERIFGILKSRFRILVFPPEHHGDMQTTVQTRIPAALCALHNFIRRHDPTDIDDYTDAIDDLASGSLAGIGDLATRATTTTAEHDRAYLKRERIAQDMWDSYTASVQRESEATSSAVSKRRFSASEYLTVLPSESGSGVLGPAGISEISPASSSFNLKPAGQARMTAGIRDNHNLEDI